MENVTNFSTTDQSKNEYHESSDYYDPNWTPITTTIGHQLRHVMDTGYDAYWMSITTTIGHQLRNRKNCPIYTRIYCPDKSYSLSNLSRIACPVWPVIRSGADESDFSAARIIRRANRKTMFELNFERKMRRFFDRS